MTQIKISECYGFDKPAFMEYFELHKDDFLTIILPKISSEADGELMAIDYYRLFYIMQCLMPLCYDLFHTWPDPAEAGEFHVIIHTDEWEELTSFLWEVLKGYDQDNDIDAYVEFENIALDMSMYMEHGDLLASPGLYEFIMKIHNKYAG